MNAVQYLWLLCGLSSHSQQQWHSQYQERFAHSVALEILHLVIAVDTVISLQADVQRRDHHFEYHHQNFAGQGDLGKDG